MVGSIRIVEGAVQTAFDVYQAIPEFDPTDRSPLSEFEERLTGRSSLVLLAVDRGRHVAFKAGYDRYQDGSWYSWLGGVVPSHRRQGIAEQLLETQEAWAVARGYRRVFVKTRNRFVAMRTFLARSGYYIVSVEAPDGGTDIADLRLLLVKEF